MLILLAGCLYIPESKVDGRVSGDSAAPVVARWYRDGDGDGSGDGSGADGSFVDAVEAPAGYVANAWDCDDGNSGDPVWVDANAASPGNGGITDPVWTIANGINGSVGCVRVRAGTYRENVTTGGKNLDILGVDGAAATTIQGIAQASVLTIEGTETVTLAGVTLMDGLGDLSSSTLPYYLGGAVDIYNSTLTLNDVVLSGNAASTGGAIFGKDASLHMHNVRFVQNAASEDGGALALDTCTTDGSDVTFLDDSAADAGAVWVQAGSLALSGVVMDADRGTDGVDGLYANGAAVTLTSGTFVDLNAALTLAVSDAKLDDLIFASTTAAVQATDLGAFSMQYSDTTTATVSGVSGDGTGNIMADPAFTRFSVGGDGSEDDLSLAAGSPCIDAGDPAVVGADGATSDMGAYP